MMNKTRGSVKITPKYAQNVLAGYGTHLTLEQVEQMLGMLHKLSKLALEAALFEDGPNLESSPYRNIVIP